MQVIQVPATKVKVKYKEVKVCVRGPFSHHLLMDFNINDNYHDYM
jgi:hypothetical protein